MDEQAQDKPSKSQLKKIAEKQQQLGNNLVKLPISVLNNFPLPDELFDAIKLAQSIKQHGGLKRQLQFIGKLMRLHDVTKIQDTYDNYYLKLHQKNKIFHLYEDWRDKFLTNEKTVFNDFLTQYPDVDRQHLHQLQRHAVNEKQSQKPPKYARQLFSFLKQTIDQQNSINDNIMEQLNSDSNLSDKNT